jgi:hypothetical protein
LPAERWPILDILSFGIAIALKETESHVTALNSIVEGETGNASM